MIKYELSNGLRVIMEPIPTCRSVSFGIWVKTGSRNEHAAQNGISHFIEHMLFKGTEAIRLKISRRYSTASEVMSMRSRLKNIHVITARCWTSICRLPWMC